MRNATLLIRTTLFMSYALFVGSGSLFASLLADGEIDSKNYAVVRVWTESKFGHAAVQAFRNNALLFNASLYPGNPGGVGKKNLSEEVPAYWMSAQEDDAHAPNAVVNLYSLNLDRMNAEFSRLKADKKYMMISVGGSDGTMFQRDSEFFSRNCASLVRDLLNAGGLQNLFEKPTGQSGVKTAGSVIRHGVPGAAKTAVEIAGAGVGGAIGVVGGFLGGAWNLENPFKAAKEGAKTGVVTGARLVDLAANTVAWGPSESFSYLNYGHPYGECSVVTPGKILELGRDARAREHKKFPKVAAW